MLSANLCVTELGVDIDVKAYRLLIRAPILNEKTMSGIYLPQDSLEINEKLMNVGKTLKIGPLAFKDERHAHFKVNEGDWIFYSKYEREAISIPPKEGQTPILCYFINDDRILGGISSEDFNKIVKDGY